MLSGLNMLDYLDPVKPILGIIIDGNVPLIVLTGLIAGLIIKNTSDKGIQTGYCNFRRIGHTLYHFGIFPEKMVYNLENSGYPELGDDLFRNKHAGLYSYILDSRCKKKNKMG